MKDAFYFMSKALFVLEIFKCLSWLFGYVEKRPGNKWSTKDWTINNYNTHIAQYVKK